MFGQLQINLDAKKQRGVFCLLSSGQPDLIVLAVSQFVLGNGQTFPVSFLSRIEILGSLGAETLLVVISSTGG